jgi:hypothetical protein
MIGDMTKLLKFTENVSQRVTYLKKLKKDKFISKSATLTNETHNDYEPEANLHSGSGHVFRGPKKVSHLLKEWARLKWKLPLGTVIPDTESGLRFLAERTELGISSRGLLLAAWELMPWSWAIDWFTNFGEYLEATNNSLGLEPASMCVMRKRITTYKHGVSNLPAGVYLTGKTWKKFEQKERLVVGTPVATAYASIPVLTTGQWSILGSLAALRSGRPRFARN